MPAGAQVDTKRPLRIAREGGELTVVKNIGNPTVYYKAGQLGESVSSTNNDGSLVKGKSLALAQTNFFIATEPGAQVEITAGPVLTRGPGARPAVSGEFPTVREYGALGDGKTDDWPAIQAGIADLGSNGGTLVIPSGNYFTSKVIEFNVPGRLLGAGCGVTEKGATTIRPAPETTGILVNNEGDSVVSGMVLFSRNVAEHKSWAEKESADVGIDVKAHGTFVEDVVVEGFGSKGISVDTSVSGVCTLARFYGVRAAYNFTHGFYFAGLNTTTATLLGCESQFNKGWGFWSGGSAAAIVHLNSVAESNTLGAFIDKSNGNQYYSPFVEPGTGSNVTLEGFNALWMTSGTYTEPTITDTGASIIMKGQGFASSVVHAKGFGVWAHAAPAAQHAEVKVPAAFAAGASGFGTEAQAKEVRDKLTEVVEILKEYGMTK